MGTYRKLNPEQLEKILDGHELWVESRGQVGERADLNRADLGGTKLDGADLSRAGLGGACLMRAALAGVVLKEADLSGADLSGAVLKGSDLSAACLAGADLTGADLRGAKLGGADFKAADLQGAKADNRAQLAMARNLWNASGPEFGHDELDLERTAREQRAGLIFGRDEKGEVFFSIPAHLPPWLVARALDGLSLMAEGVRLALTADFETPAELAGKAANPALWADVDEPHAARLGALGLRNPIEGSLAINRDLGQMILALAGEGDTGMVKGLATRLDRAEARLHLAGKTARNGLAKMRALLRNEDAKLSINGINIDLHDREAGDCPGNQNDKNHTGKPENR